INAMPARDAEGSSDSSALAEALATVGDRWTLLIVAALLDGPRRFNDIAEMVPGIAPNILSQRLRHLEQQALIVAQPYSRRPPRLLYELTEGGRELAGAVRNLADWGARHAHGAEPLRHAALARRQVRGCDDGQRALLRGDDGGARLGIEADTGETVVDRARELGGDDRAQRRDSDQAGDSRDRVVDAGGQAGVVLVGIGE